MQDYLVEVSPDHLEHLVSKVGASCIISSPHHLSIFSLLNRPKLTTQLFFFTQVTKVVPASPALQAIRVYLESKVTRDFQVYLVFRVSQEREGSLVLL